MASKQKRKAVAVPSKNSFAESIHLIARQFSLFTVFDDFLTLTMAACTQNLQTGMSWHEDEYMETIDKYKNLEVRHEFPRALAYLVTEMEERYPSGSGNDVLGEFFEMHISNGRNGQYFTPFHICNMMARFNGVDNTEKKTLRIIDPTCGSGRMLLASSRVHGPNHEYYGIDIDRTCVKMAALNLFLNGVFGSEIMCANALMPEDFVIAYRISLAPLGIFKIEKKEDSRLWHLYSGSFIKEKLGAKGSEIILDPTPFEKRNKDDSIQLGLF